MATGCEGGNVALLELAEGLASAHRNDKTSVTAVSVLDYARPSARIFFSKKNQNLILQVFICKK